MALWLTRRDVESVLTMEDAIAAVEEGFRQLALGDVEMPQRLGVGVAKYGTWGAAMPAYVGGQVDRLGLKLVTLARDNPSQRGLPAILASVLLLNPRSGQLLAAMEGAFLTAVRTGAGSGVATKYLARPDASNATVFGAGVQARTQLAAVCAVRPIRRALVLARSLESARRFADEMSDRLGIAVEATEDVRGAVEQADVIIAATSAHAPLFDGHWLQPGTHINGVGSHMPTARELDTVTIQRAKIVADHVPACLAEAGDLIIPLREDAITEDHIYAGLGEIVAGQKPGRTSDDEITLFKSVGLAIQDVATAALVYDKAQAAGVGQVLPD